MTLLLIILAIFAYAVVFGFIIPVRRRSSKEDVNYSKDYMNNPIVRNMNERDHK